jgi:BlaI family transcriptional regulator, penicillinase repressor
MARDLESGPAVHARLGRTQVTDPLGPLQFAVMEGLWLRRSATAAEITSGLNACRAEPLSTKTILTCLTRLEEKGLVSHSKESRAYLFSPTKSEDEISAWYLAERFRSIIDRFGDLAVAVFVEQIGQDPDRYQFLCQLVEGNDEGGGP